MRHPAGRSSRTPNASVQSILGVGEGSPGWVAHGKLHAGRELAALRKKEPVEFDMVPAKRKRWSQRVTETSDALDLEAGVFTKKDPREIAESLKRSAERSRRRKSDPFRSAMSMLTFYINRAGKQLPASQRARLEAAKDELREMFGRPRRRQSSSGAKRS